MERPIIRTPSARLFFLLFVFAYSYLMLAAQTGNYRAWIENHVFLVLLVFGGLYVRLRFIRLGGFSSETPTPKLVSLMEGYVALTVFLTFIGGLVPAMVWVFSSGLKVGTSVLSYWGPPSAGQALSMVVLLFLAVDGNFDRDFLRMLLVITLYMVVKSLWTKAPVSEEAHEPAEAEEDKGVVQPVSVLREVLTFLGLTVVTVFSWLMLHFLIVDDWSKGVATAACSRFPFAWQRFPCELGSVLRYINADLFTDLVVTILLAGTIGLLNRFDDAARWLWQQMVGRRSQTA